MTLPSSVWGGRLTMSMYLKMTSQPAASGNQMFRHNSPGLLVDRCVAANSTDFVLKSLDIAADRQLNGHLRRLISESKHALYNDDGAVVEWAAFLERATGPPLL